MESGEGMVAIVRGSRHAGLTVTVLPDRHRSHKRKCGADFGHKSLQESPTRVCKSNVETSTDRILGHPDIPTNNILYASNYQFANCLRPSPPQRTNNFPVNYASGATCQVASETRYVRNSFVYHGKKSSHLPPCLVDHFADSLRKYPSVTNSSEFIRKILNYAHIKHHAKRHQSKSMRSLIQKSTSQQLNKEAKKEEKRGYSHDAPQGGRRLKHSVSTIANRYSSQEEFLNYTYDYLKSASLVPRVTDVRYLTEMQRVFCDRLQNIIDNKPAMCPRIQSRYLQHKKHCQGVNRSGEPVKKKTEVQTSTQAPVELSSSDILRSPQKVCFCQNTAPCQCKTQTKISYHRLLKGVKDWVKNIPVYSHFSEQDKLKRAEIVNNLTKSLKNILNHPDFEENAKKEILKYLDTMPMWRPANSKDEILFKEQIADNLLQTLANLERVDEVKKVIQDLPFNFDRYDLNTIAENIVLKLHSKPTDVNSRDAIKLQLLDLFKELQLLNDGPFKGTAMLEMAENCANKLYHTLKDTEKNKEVPDFDEIENDIQQKIVAWCKDIPEFSQINILMDKDSISFLAKKLCDYKLHNRNDDEVQLKMQKDIENWLDKLAEKYNKKLNSETKNELSNKLIQRLLLEESASKNILGLLKEWFKEIPEITNSNDIKSREALLNLFMKLKRIQLQNKTHVNAQAEMKKVILNWLHDLFRDRDITVDPRTQENLVNKLIFKLKSLPQQANYTEYKQLHQDVFTCLKEIFDIPSEHIQTYYSEAIKKLVSTINTISDISDEVMIDTLTKSAIQELSQIHSKSVGTDNDLKENELLDENELINTRYLRMQRSNGNKEKFLNQTLLNEIDNILQTHLNGTQLKNVRENIRKEIEKNMDTESPSDWKNILHQLTYILTAGTDLPTNKIEEICNKITTSIKRNYADVLNEKRTIYSDNENDSLLNSTPVDDKKNPFIRTTDHAVSPIRNTSQDDQGLHEGSDYEQYWKNILKVVEDWLDLLKLPIDGLERSKIVYDLATDIIDRQKYLQLSENKTFFTDELEHLKYQVFRRFCKLYDMQLLSNIISKVKDLNNAIMSIKILEITKQSHKLNSKQDDSVISSFRDSELSVQNLEAGLDKTPANSYRSQEEYELILELAKNLMEIKINEVDDILLKNKISKWLLKMFDDINETITNNLVVSLKKHLIQAEITEKVTTMQNNKKQKYNAGTTYKEMLWETISKTLPSIQSLSEQEMYDFNLLKERLADAFINLHFFANNKETRDKFKAKLFEEVNKFCHEYLKRYPDTPLNSKQLNNDLYNALKMVSVSNIESIRSEVEQVRLKEEIIDWIKEVGLINLTDSKLKINPMILDLTKRLYNIEKNNNSHLEKKDNEMKVQITKFLQQLHLENDGMINLQDLVNQLIERLKATDKSRTFSISKIGRCDKESFSRKQSTTTQYVPLFPPSTLSFEDRTHLESIRKRMKDSDFSRKMAHMPTFKDASLDPLPQNIGLQTDTYGRNMDTIHTSRTSLIENSNLYRQISPQVIIKEFHWDSNDSNHSLQMSISPTVADKTQHKTHSTAQTEHPSRETVDNINNRVQSPRTIQHPELHTQQIFEKHRASLVSAKDLRIVPRVEKPQRVTNDSTSSLIHETKRARKQNHSLVPCNVDIRKGRRDNICCNCRERIHTKCRGRPQSGCQKHCVSDGLKYCSKCCGDCPHPCYMFFRKDF